MTVLRFQMDVSPLLSSVILNALAEWCQAWKFNLTSPITRKTALRSGEEMV